MRRATRRAARALRAAARARRLGSRSSRTCSIDVLHAHVHACQQSRVLREQLAADAAGLHERIRRSSCVRRRGAAARLSAAPVSSRYVRRARHRARYGRAHGARPRRASPRPRARAPRDRNRPSAPTDLRRHGRVPGTSHRLAQRDDLPGVERAALHRHGALLLEDGDALFDDEVCGRRQRADGSERDDQPRHDADAAEREPPLEAHVPRLNRWRPFLYMSAVEDLPCRQVVRILARVCLSSSRFCVGKFRSAVQHSRARGLPRATCRCYRPGAPDTPPQRRPRPIENEP